MTRLWVKRIGEALVPDGTESVEALSFLPFDRTLRAEVEQPRNLKHHKLFWSLCARIGKGIGKNAEFVERAFKIETGHFSHYTLADGRDCIVLGSIAFHKMDQIQFDHFWRDCLEIMFRVWKIAPEGVNDLLEDKR